MVRPRHRRSPLTLNQLAEAYSDGASGWDDGPARLYRRLAQLLVEFSPVALANRSVLDLGSGTGFGSRAALAVGAQVIETDLAPDMLRVDRSTRPPAAAGNAEALPFRSAAFDVVLAAFSLNHLDDPSEGVREAGRVGRLLLASTYAADDDHPAKLAVETALGEVGWTRPAWYSQLKAAMAAWGTVEDATAVVERGGLSPIRVERRRVAFPELGPTDMVAWRMGLAQSAAFSADLDRVGREQVVARAIELLGPDPAPIVRDVIFVAASVS